MKRLISLVFCFSILAVGCVPKSKNYIPYAPEKSVSPGDLLGDDKDVYVTEVTIKQDIDFVVNNTEQHNTDYDENILSEIAGNYGYAFDILRCNEDSVLYLFTQYYQDETVDVEIRDYFFRYFLDYTLTYSETVCAWKLANEYKSELDEVCREYDKRVSDIGQEYSFEYILNVLENQGGLDALRSLISE